MTIKNELPPHFDRWIDFYRHLKQYDHHFMSDDNFHTFDYYIEPRFDIMYGVQYSGVREFTLYRIDKSFLYKKALEELENNMLSSEETERIINRINTQKIPVLEYPIMRNSFKKLRYIKK